MFEDLVANMTSSPMLIGVCAAFALVSFFFGWLCKGSGAKRREVELKHGILEAKRSIPQLESSVRNRELQITHLEEEVKDLNDHTGEIEANLEAKDLALRSAMREARNLTSELQVVRGDDNSADNIIMDGFDDEEPAPSADSKLTAKLQKTEALYDKLRKGLIQRDERIDELEAQLAADDEPRLPASDELQATVAELDTASGALREKIAAHENTIKTLRDDLGEARQEKDMLADMAKRRSENNEALKEASAETEAQLPELEDQIETQGQTIEAREASINRLLGELGDSKADNKAQDQHIETLSAQIAERVSAMTALESSLGQRNDRISLLTEELDDTRDKLQQTTIAKQAFEETIAEQQAKTDTTAGEIEHLRQTHAAEARENDQTLADGIEEHEQTAAALHSTIEDRNFKIESLNRTIEALQEDLKKLSVNMNSLEQHASEKSTAANQLRTEFESEVSSSQQQLDVMNREAEDLRAGLAQREKWLAKLKESLAEREAKCNKLGADLSAVQDRQDDLQTKLEEQSQIITVYKSVIEDHESSVTTDPDNEVPAPVESNVNGNAQRRFATVHRIHRAPRRPINGNDGQHPASVTPTRSQRTATVVKMRRGAKRTKAYISRTQPLVTRRRRKLRG